MQKVTWHSDSNEQPNNTVVVLDDENQTNVAFAALSLSDGISSLMSRINCSITTDNQQKIELKCRKTRMGRN